MKSIKTTRTLPSMAFAAVALVGALAAPVVAQGPVVLMSLDAEDGGPDSYHGPSSAYGTVLNNLLASTRGSGEGVLVIGAGKAADDDVTTFWSAVQNWTDATLYTVHGVDEISDISFDDYKMLVIASNDVQTPEGGLTQDEHNALSARKDEIADFVNSGGGLWGLMQGGFDNPFGYIVSSQPSVVDTGHAFRYMTPTVDGVRAGINEVFEVCCWHDELHAYPEALDVLAVRTKNDAPIAVGSLNATLGDFVAIGLDFKPRRVPNRLRTNLGPRKNGKVRKIRMVISGTENFDVRNVDIDSVEVNGLRPISTRYKDINTPYESYLNKQSSYDGIDADADGYEDLILRFSYDELVELTETSDYSSKRQSRGTKYEYRLDLTGQLLDGSEIKGVEYFYVRVR